jgi:hypothetical protein
MGEPESGRFETMYYETVRRLLHYDSWNSKGAGAAFRVSGHIPALAQSNPRLQGPKLPVFR